MHVYKLYQILVHVVAYVEYIEYVFGVVKEETILSQ